MLVNFSPKKWIEPDKKEIKKNIMQFSWIFFSFQAKKQDKKLERFTLSTTLPNGAHHAQEYDL